MSSEMHAANVKYLQDLEQHVAKHPDLAPNWTATIARVRADVAAVERVLAGAPASSPQAIASTAIDPRTVTVSEVHRMSNDERRQYMATLTGSDDRVGLPDVGPFRMLSAEEARSNPFGRQAHGPSPKPAYIPDPNIKLPENVRASDVHKMTNEQQREYLLRSGITPPPGPVMQKGPTVGGISATGAAGDKMAGGGRLPSIGGDDRKW